MTTVENVTINAPIKNETNESVYIFNLSNSNGESLLFQSKQLYNINTCVYIPKYDSFTNYLSRVVYRVGARWEHSGMEVKSRAVKDFGITFGIGLPMNVLSKVNIGVEIGQKGTTDAGLLKENYTNIMLGFSLSDVWFIKRKYD